MVWTPLLSLPFAALAMTSGTPRGLLELGLRTFDDHVPDRSTGRDHREDVVFLDHFGFHHAGAIVVFDGLLEHAVDVGGALDAQTLYAVRLRQLHEVRIALEIHAAQTIVEEQLL